MKAIIFDFNGTLIDDEHIVDQSWDNLLSQHGVQVSDEERRTQLHGRVGQDILRNLLGIDDKKKLDETVEHLNVDYRRIFRQEDVQLGNGVVEFLDLCVSKNIPIAIATSAPSSNFELYIEKFGLHKWFSPEHIICNDGHIPSKPKPDIFLLAAERLGVPIGECVIFEDAELGIQAARAAHPERVIIVDYHQKYRPSPGIITDLTQAPTILAI